MNELRQAAQQALEVLEFLEPYYATERDARQNAITALRAALAEPVQEPVAAANLRHTLTEVGYELGMLFKPQRPAEPVQEPVATMTVREDMGADFKFSRAHTLQPGQQFYLYATPLAEESPCNPHPKAPHGFMRNASHTEGRYVCECEAWDPWEAGYQAGMESAMRMEAESAHILGENPDSSQDTGRAP